MPNPTPAYPPLRRIKNLSINTRSYATSQDSDKYTRGYFGNLSSSSESSSSEFERPHITDKRCIEWRDRKIHKLGSGKGGWPADQIEIERQEAEHCLLRILLGCELASLPFTASDPESHLTVLEAIITTAKPVPVDPYHGPVLETLATPSRSGRDRKKILDIGTGSGVWAVDMADSFPDADVIGLDEIPMQPELVPPNCEFHIWDMSLPLPYNRSTFDIIHIRFASTRIPSYLSILQQSLTLLKPGGLLLLFENFTISPQPQKADLPLPKGVKAFYDAYKRSLRNSNIKLITLEDVLGLLRDQGEGGGGLKEIKGDLIKVPIGHGSGKMNQLSKLHLINLKAWIESCRYMILKSGGYTDSEFDILSEALIQNLENEELYTCYHSLWVRKA